MLEGLLKPVLAREVGQASCDFEVISSDPARKQNLPHGPLVGICRWYETAQRPGQASQQLAIASQRPLE